ncbi:MAG: ABC transporter ATP-binding protein [Promethearchaeota archaeon]
MGLRRAAMSGADEEEEEALKQARAKRTMTDLEVVRALFGFIGRQRKLTTLLIVAVFVNAVVQMLRPLIFQTLIDVGLGGSIGATSGNLQVIYEMGFYFILTVVVTVVCLIVQNWGIQFLATHVMYELRREAFENLQKLSFDYYDAKDRSAGKIISYITNDVETIQELVSSGLLTVFASVFSMFAALGFMIWLSPVLTAVTFTILPVILVCGLFIFKKARRYFVLMRRRVATVTGRLQESIGGMREIKSLAIEDHDYEAFEEATRKELEINNKAARLFSGIPALIMTVITGGLGVVILVGARLYMVDQLSQGTLFAFMIYIFQFVGPVVQVISFFTVVQNAMAAGERVIKLIRTPTSITEVPDPVVLEDVRGEVEFENVTFWYEEGLPVVKDLTLRVKPKERVAIVGYTGAGKTTLITLLQRFYDPQKGRILVDGVDIRRLSLRSLRGNMGVVLQDNFLFSGTVRENIRYGKLDATDEEVESVARQIGAHEFIVNMDAGYDTEVKERGVILSVGQRQLIAFARALIADPPILILDEATSAVDPYSELIIQQALEKLLKDRTSFVIAHRLSTILNSDRIVVMDRGRIVEVGSHEELMERPDGLYRHLYLMQFKDATHGRKLGLGRMTS